MKEITIKILYRYKDWMRDIGVFASEYSTGGRFINEALLLITYFAVRGYNITLWQGILIYLSALIVMRYLGRILIWLSIPQYGVKLNNEMNPEILDIIERLKRIEDALKK